MRFLSSRQYIVVGVAVLLVVSIAVVTQNRYAISMKDLSKYIESLDIGLDSSSRKQPVQTAGKFTDNNDPERITEHKIQNKVNELLKKKIAEELKFEREEMEKKKKDLQDKLKKSADEVADLRTKFEVELGQEKTKLENANKQIESLKAKNVITNKVHKINSDPSNYVKHVYSFESNDEAKTYGATKADLVILCSINTFGPGRTLKDFFEMIDTIDYKKSKTSLALFIASEEMFKEVDTYISEVFQAISEAKDIKEVEDAYPKITLINSKYLESQFQISRADRQNAEFQRERRKILSRMRNFLVSHGLEDEKYTLFLDSDIIKLPKNLMTVMVQSKKEIGTIRIDMMNPDGHSVHPDYDLNSWAGDRKKPTAEEEKKLDTDPEFKFIPGPGENKIQMLDLSQNLEKYGLSKEADAAYELRSVGGGVLFALAQVYKQGVLFPPYYAVGTTWDRKEGWDGIETEGLCYIANAIGYKCWGFPNLKGGHTTGL